MLICCYSKLGHNVLLISPAQVSQWIQTAGSAPPIMSKVDANPFFLIVPRSVSQSWSVMSVRRARGSSFRTATTAPP